MIKDKSDVIAIIKEFNAQQGGTSGGFHVPRHQHNGSDMIKVLMGDLGYDMRGLNFPVTDGSISFQVSPQNSDNLSLLAPQSTPANLLNANLYVGTSPNFFNNIQFNARTNFQITVGNQLPIHPVNTFYNFNEDNIDINSTAPLYGSGWYMTLPINDSSNPPVTLPPSPVLGQICYGSPDSGTTGFLYVCESVGTWTQK